MKKIDLFFGFLIGLLADFIGSYIFIVAFTQHNFTNGIQLLKNGGNLGKLITLGAILNLAIFFILLKINKELMARGIILSMFLLILISLFI